MDGLERSAVVKGVEVHGTALALAPTALRIIRLNDGLTATIYQNWELPPRVLRVWESLVEQYGDAGVFLHYGWFQQWWSAFASQYPPQIIVIKHNNETLGIFPFFGEAGEDGPLSLRSMTSEVYYDFLVSPSDRAQAISGFLETLRKLKSPPPSAVITYISPDSPNEPALKTALRGRRTPYGYYQKPYAPYLDLRSTSWEQYTGSLDSKLKNNLRRGRKRAEQGGALFFEVIRGGDSLEDVMDEVFDVESQSWKGTRGTAIRSDPRKVLFYRRMAKWASSKGLLYIFALRLDGRMIAFDLCVAGRRTMFMIKTGYDAVLAGRLSPGNLMRYQVLEYLFRTGEFDRYDFLGACEPWKLEWTSRTTSVISIDIYPSTIAGLYAYAHKYAWKEPFNRFPRFVSWVRRLRAINRG